MLQCTNRAEAKLVVAPSVQSPATAHVGCVLVGLLVCWFDSVYSVY